MNIITVQKSGSGSLGTVASLRGRDRRSLPSVELTIFFFGIQINRNVRNRKIDDSKTSGDLQSFKFKVDTTDAFSVKTQTLYCISKTRTRKFFFFIVDSVYANEMIYLT